MKWFARVCVPVVACMFVVAALVVWNSTDANVGTSPGEAGRGGPGRTPERSPGTRTRAQRAAPPSPPPDDAGPPPACADDAASRLLRRAPAEVRAAGEASGRRDGAALAWLLDEGSVQHLELLLAAQPPKDPDLLAVIDSRLSHAGFRGRRGHLVLAWWLQAHAERPDQVRAQMDAWLTPDASETFARAIVLRRPQPAGGDGFLRRTALDRPLPFAAREAAVRSVTSDVEMESLLAGLEPELVVVVFEELPGLSSRPRGSAAWGSVHAAGTRAGLAAQAAWFDEDFLRLIVRTSGEEPLAADVRQYAARRLEQEAARAPDATTPEAIRRVVELWAVGASASDWAAIARFLVASARPEFVEALLDALPAEATPLEATVRTWADEKFPARVRKAADAALRRFHPDDAGGTEPR